MPQYLYQAAYTPESLAAQIKNPQDRLEVVVFAAGRLHDPHNPLEREVEFPGFSGQRF